MKEKLKYYSLKNILAKDAQYNIIFGERSNGKTYACLRYALDRYFKYGEQFGLVRRWREDFQSKRGQTMFDAHIANGVISELSDGVWTGVFYQSGRWWLSKIDKDGKKFVSDEPIGYAFALSNMEHDKSTSYPKITTIIFDEFLTRDTYQQDEFVLFMNIVSTIVRQRDNVKIFMLGNTVNKSSPYFNEMGLKHISQMKKGNIDVYTYGDSKLRVAVEYADSISKKGKPSDIYFAFDNPKLHMITGGEWEIGLYPHRPVKYVPKDILFTYFIKWETDILQCEIVQVDNNLFTFIHRKTTEIKDEDSDLVFSLEYDARPNWIRNILKTNTNVTKKILKFFKEDKVFYQDNDVGEIVRNYLQWCGTVKMG